MRIILILLTCNSVNAANTNTNTNIHNTSNIIILNTNIFIILNTNSNTNTDYNIHTTSNTNQHKGCRTLGNSPSLGSRRLMEVVNYMLFCRSHMEL